LAARGVSGGCEGGRVRPAAGGFGRIACYLQLPDSWRGGGSEVDCGARAGGIVRRRTAAALRAGGCDRADAHAGGIAAGARAAASGTGGRVAGGLGLRSGDR
jgi:hypothetical protein